MKKVIIPLLLLLLLIPCSVFAMGNDGSVAYSDISPKLSSYPYYIVVRQTQYNSDGSLNNIDVRMYYFTSKPTFTLAQASPTFVGANYLSYSGSGYFIEKNYTKSGGWSTTNDRVTSGIDASGSALFNVAYVDAKFSGTSNIWLKYELVGNNVDIKTSTNTYITSKPVLPIGTLSYVSDSGLIENGTMLFRFNANIPFALNYNMSDIKYSLDNTTWHDMFDSSGVIVSPFYTNTMQYYNDQNVLKGEFTIKYPVQLNTLNKCYLYIKSPDGQVFNAGRDVDLVNHGSGNMPGSGQSTSDIVGHAPDRANYPDGILGSVQWGFDTLIYYILYPAKQLGSLFTQMISAISDFVSQASGFNNFLNGMLSGMPTWVTTPFQILFTITIIMTIVYMIRR